jgi:3-phenylpropionate/trans-cinnamate dioxygenase ferredoxin subunit
VRALDFHAAMKEPVWVPVVDESQLAEDTINVAFPKGVSIILIRKGDRIFALRNRCAHMACTLASGRLDGDILQCPCHDWRFDITTGEFLAAREIRVPIYRCKTESGTVLIQLEEP